MIPRGPLIGHNVCSFLLLKKVSYCIGSLTYSYKNLCLKYFRRCIHRLVLNSEYSPVCGPSTRRYLAPQRVFLLPIETVMSSGWLYFSTLYFSTLYFSNVFGLWAVADAPRGSLQICWTSGRLKYFQPTHWLFNDVPLCCIWWFAHTCGGSSK